LELFSPVDVALMVRFVDFRPEFGDLVDSIEVGDSVSGQLSRDGGDLQLQVPIDKDAILAKD